MQVITKEKFTENEFPRLKFENSLLLETLELFSIVVKADGVISSEEIDYVDQYFSSFYPKHISEELLQKFKNCLETDPKLEETTDRINSKLGYENRIFILMKIYELIKSDNVEKIELELARKISDHLQIKKIDNLFVESIYGLAEFDPKKLKDSTIIPIYVSSDISKADVLLPFNDLDLEIYAINGFYCVINKNPSRPYQTFVNRRKDQKTNHKECRGNQIFISDVSSQKFPIKTNFSTGLRSYDLILVNNYPIKFQDLKFYLNNKVHPKPIRKLFLEEVGKQIILTSKSSIDNFFKIEIRGSFIVVKPLNENVDLQINGTKFTVETYANLNDYVYVNGLRLDFRKIIFEQGLQGELSQLNGEKLSYSITNCPRGDLIVDDQLKGNWKSHVVKNGKGYFFDKGNCPHEIYLNNTMIKKNCELSQDDVIFIHGNFIRFDFNNGKFEKTKFCFRDYIADKIRYLINDSSVLLDDISFSIEHGDLVGIMGPSGCGKSTLMNVLNGNIKPKKGEILLDSYALSTQYGMVKELFGYVPQDDLLFGNLTVFENLYYNARLRFPNKTKMEINALISKVLSDIGLSNRRNTQVGNPSAKILSGGERKRLNIGLELLGDPEVYFLDEPLSGLSSRDSEKILDLLSRFTLKGKIVIVIIHQPSSKLYKMLDKIILLDRGGKLAFYGGCLEALQYFEDHSQVGMNTRVECPSCNTVTPDILLDVLEEPLRDINGIPLHDRKYSPTYWQRRFYDATQRRRKIKRKFENAPIPLPPPKKIGFVERGKRFNTLLSRNFKTKLRDRSNVIITFLEAPLLGAGVAFVLKYSATKDKYSLYYNDFFPLFIFLTVIICLFLGMTNSIDEIIRSRNILRREKMLNVRNRTYLAAKVLTLLTFAIIQNFLFLGVGFWILEATELYFHFLIFLLFLSASAIAIGLFISSIPNLSSRAAYNIVPLILIPQIILGGMLIEYKDMNKQLRLGNIVNKVDTNNELQNETSNKHRIPLICQFMPSRWAQEGLMVLFYSFNSYQSMYDILKTREKNFNGNGEVKKWITETKNNHKNKFKKYGNHRICLRIHQVNSIKDILESPPIQRKIVASYPFLLSKKAFPQKDTMKFSQSQTRVPTFYQFLKISKFLQFSTFRTSTVFYNLVVLLGFTIIFNFLTLCNLKFREQIIRTFFKLKIVRST